MTDEQINEAKKILYQKKDWTKEDDQKLAVLNLRDIVNSVACYDGLICATEKNQFIKKSMDRIADKALAKSVLADQREFFRTHASVKVAVHTDFEGYTYNSISWK